MGKPKMHLLSEKNQSKKSMTCMIPIYDIWERQNLQSQVKKLYGQSWNDSNNSIIFTKW